MLRTVTPTVFLLISLLWTSPALAQSYPSLPSRIMISSTARTLKVGQVTEIRVALLDEQGQEIAPGYETPINLICTKLKDLGSAKSAAQEIKDLPDGVVELPPGEESTVQWSFIIPNGESAATIKFRSQQSGTIRIFAENEKLVAGSTLIGVIRETSRAAQTSMFRTVSFQEGPPPPAYVLEFEGDGTNIPPLINGKWVRKLTVTLKSEGELVPAKELLKVYLKIESGPEVEFSHPSPVIIPQGEAGSEVIELRSRVGGEVEVSAQVQRVESMKISPARATYKFPKDKRATKLLVDAQPSVGMANGLEPIQLRVRAVDDGNNAIRAGDEKLEARDVIFRLEGNAFGLKFDEGITKLTIPKAEMAAVIKVFGSAPLSGTQIIAESEDGAGKVITGTTKVAFRFPWWQLGLAMLGGLITLPLRKPPLSKAARRRRRRKTETGTNRIDLAKKCLTALMMGGLFYVLFFFSAAVMSSFNWSGITINLTRLPLQNVVAAFTMGFFGVLLVGATPFLVEKAESAVNKLKALRANQPVA